VILGLAILIQYRLVTDGQTDRQTHDDIIYRASTASRSKKYYQILLLCLVSSESMLYYIVRIV